MANRIVGNVYIIDSSTGAGNPLIMGGNSGAWLDNILVSAFAFWGTDTTAAIELVFANDTASTAFRSGHGYANANLNWSSFGEAVYFKELRCKTLTNGTGFIYFK